MNKLGQLCCMLGVSGFLLLPAGVAMGDESSRASLLFTLDDLEAILGGDEIAPEMLAKLNAARVSVETATDEELMVPPSIQADLRLLEFGVSSLRLRRDLANTPLNEKPGGKSKAWQVSTNSLGGTPGFDEAPLEIDYPAYDMGILSIANPNISNRKVEECINDAEANPDGFFEGVNPDAFFSSFLLLCELWWNEKVDGGGTVETDPLGDCGTLEGTTAGSRGVPYAPANRHKAMSEALVLEAVKDIAEQFCGMTVLGFNLSPICVVTDIAYFVVEAVDESQELCNDAITGAEVQATWWGIQRVHSNLNHVHEDIEVQNLKIDDLDMDLENHDALLEAHDTDIKGDVASHDTDMKVLLEQSRQNQELILELLTTPSGRRPGWNE